MKSFLILVLAAMASIVFAQQSDVLPGYPDRSGKIDLEKQFQTPPPGYGEVPFYWWIGDTLTREHISWQLDMLKQKHITSLQVNYCHTDTGGIIYGRTFPSKPGLFTEQWWDLFGWFMSAAKKRGMSVSLSDYTLGVGQGSYVDEMLEENSDLNGYELRSDNKELLRGERFTRTYDDSPLLLKAYELDENDNISGRGKILTGDISDGQIDWSCPWRRGMVVEVRAERHLPSLDPMHPESGKSYVRHFFQRFEDRFPEESKGGLNFFFSDELNFNLHGYIWNDIFQTEFSRRKGYDILPFIDALFFDIGDITQKVRLDYNDVMVSLSEENFFIPVYDWHQQRGLLFGCDHGGRGRDVAEFGDYFRTQRWNQAPGCDQPMLQKDIVKNKVASSISHLYERQRVWLEGFHSSNWSTSSAQLADAIFANYAMGQNLLSLHGLYYTTMGCRWEWAAPCNHFHQPYWDEMKPLLECTERLSYLLSQGYHSADVAILYPVEPVVTGYGNEAVETAFAAGENIYRDGIDFDFMDYQTLARAKVSDGRLNVAGESFAIVVVPAMRAIRHSSLEKLYEFARSGGIVINIGPLPEASDIDGRNGRKLSGLVSDIFGGKYDHVFSIDSPDKTAELISGCIDRDFTVLTPESDSPIPYVMHRCISGKDLYAVYNVGRNVRCRFRSYGAAELWDPWTGEKKRLAVADVNEKGTEIIMPLERSEIQLIMFNPEEDPIVSRKETINKNIDELILDGEWEFELEPILDNRYGDFHWPATDEKLGAFVYRANYEQLGGECRKAMQNFSFGERFKILGAVPSSVDEKTVLANLPPEKDGIVYEGRLYEWSPYEYSWRWGVEGDYGHQGWHGLKAEMYDDFIRLGDIERVYNGMIRKTETSGFKDYYLYTRVEAPRTGEYEAEWGEMLPAGFYVNGIRHEPDKSVGLLKGTNDILLHYSSYGVTRFALRDGNPNIISETLNEAPLRMKFRGDVSLLEFDSREITDSRVCFTFKSAPGLEAMEFTAFGLEPEVYAGNMECRIEKVCSRGDGAVKYRAVLPECVRRPVDVSIYLTERQGYAGGAAIDGPVKLICGKGLFFPGDWCGNDALCTYSGAAWYRKSFKLDSLPDGRAMIDLGDVVSTAKVMVNGKEAGLRLTAPWKVDITDLLQQGDNIIEIRVCNTAANIFSSSPTIYCGDVKSGLLGPVRIIFER